MMLWEGPSKQLSHDDFHEVTIQSILCDADGEEDDVVNAHQDMTVNKTIHVPDWDPFGSIMAKDGYTYIGKISFMLFGPFFQYFNLFFTDGWW